MLTTDILVFRDKQMTGWDTTSRTGADDGRTYRTLPKIFVRLNFRHKSQSVYRNDLKLFVASEGNLSWILELYVTNTWQ